MKLAVMFVCVCLCQVYGEEDTKKLVQVEQGMLEGTVSVTDTGVKIATFSAVPYAKPPVGPLRFKAPQLPEKWQGVRVASEDTFTMCAQMMGGQEDCLLLNIVAPLDMGDKLPVMFWIHGGAFFLGSASFQEYNLESFAQRGMVMVAANYRLSAMGFLSLNGSDVSPNAGLKDQVAALRWVQRNIANFGGDPNNVTVFGESAGSASVQYLLISPITEGLFSRAIMQSGSACNNWAFREPNLIDAFALGESLGKKTSNPQELADFLRSLSAEDINENISGQWIKNKEENHLNHINLQTVPFLPTVEYQVPDGDSTEEVLLPDRPATLLKQGKFKKVPQIIGMNSLEAALLAQVPNVEEWPQLESNWEFFVPLDMKLERGSPGSKHVATRVREFFFHNQTLNEMSGQAYLDVASDADWTWKLSECAKYTAENMPGQLWLYLFTYISKNSLTCSTQDCDHISGATHYDEVLLMYPGNSLGEEYTTEDTHIHTSLINMWTSFARSGRPDTGTGVSWTPVEGSTLSHLVIDTNLSMEMHDFMNNRTSFWSNVYKEATKQ